MFKDFGNDLTSSSFTGEIGEDIKGPSVWLGEMSILGVVPSGTEVVGNAKPYTF